MKLFCLSQVDLLVFAFGFAARAHFRAPESLESRFSREDCPTPARSASCDRAPGTPVRAEAAPRRQCLLRFRQYNLKVDGGGEGDGDGGGSSVRMCHKSRSAAGKLTDALLANETTAWSSCRSHTANPIDASVQIQVLQRVRKRFTKELNEWHVVIYVCVCVCAYRSSRLTCFCAAGGGVASVCSAGIILSERERAETYSGITYRERIAVAIAAAAAAALVTEGACGQQTEQGLITIVS